MTANICFGPSSYVAEELLRAEGFTEVRYVPSAEGFSFPPMSHTDELASAHVRGIVGRLSRGCRSADHGGVHSGCYELFAHEPVRTIGDLKGRKVSISTLLFF